MPAWLKQLLSCKVKNIKAQKRGYLSVDYNNCENSQFVKGIFGYKRSKKNTSKFSADNNFNFTAKKCGMMGKDSIKCRHNPRS